MTPLTRETAGVCSECRRDIVKDFTSSERLLLDLNGAVFTTDPDGRALTEGTFISAVFCSWNCLLRRACREVAR